MESMQSGLVMVGAPGIPHTWEMLFTQALKVIGEIGRYGRDDPFRTFGGGTVLMLRYGHRFSKDIDIFVPDPEREPDVLMPAREFMTRHAAAVFQQLEERYVQLKQQFDAVDALHFHPTFDQACDILKGSLAAMLEAGRATNTGTVSAAR